MLPRSVLPAREDGVPGADGPLAVTRIWPRAQGRLSLELVGADGTLLAGQWFADDADRERIARSTRQRAAHAGHVQLRPATNSRGEPVGTVLVQAHGADRRLPALSRHLSEPRTSLLVHRPERRAVVHRPAPEPGDGQYLRILRPGRTAEVVRVAELATDLLVHAPGVTAPAVVAHLPDDGVVVTAALPGRSIRETGATGVPAGPAGAHASGRLLRVLAGASPPGGLAHRDAAAELEWLGVWLDRVRHHLPAVHGRLAPALEPVARHLHRTSPVAPAVVHGDLHDGQLLVADDGGLGVLDWDTLAVGEGALDAANLWAHTDLRRLLGEWPPAHAAAVWAAVVEGWAPSAGELERAAAYRRLILLRLACQYAFRPARADVVDELAVLATGP